MAGNAKFSNRDFDLFNQYRSKMLKFLGLFMTDMCHFHEIPADEASVNMLLIRLTFEVARFYLIQAEDDKRVEKKRGRLLVYSGSARVFGYSVFRGVLNRVYGILQLKYGYSVYHFL